VGGEAGDEAGDLDDQLGALLGEEVGIGGGLVVLPGVVGDGQADVALQVGVVGHPPLRAGVEQRGGGFLPAVAAALPGEQSPGQPGLAGRRPGLVEAPPAVAEQGPGEGGEAQGEQGEDEQLVPEHVPAVAFAVQAAGADAGVESGGVGREGLEQVEHVEVQRQGGFAVGVDLDREALPELSPRLLVGGEQRREARGARYLGERGQPGRGDRPVARGDEGRHFVDDHRLAVGDGHLDELGGLIVLADRAAGQDGPGDAGAGRDRDPHRALVGLRLQQCRVRFEMFCGQHGKVAV